MARITQPIPDLSLHKTERGERIGAPSNRLRTLLGRLGIIRTRANDASPQPNMHLSETVQITRSRESLEHYLRQVGILGTDQDPNSTYMAAVVQMLPKLDVPPELDIVHINPDNITAADDFRIVAAQNLAADHCPTPYADPSIDESNKSYYVGYVTMPGQEPMPAVTLETINYAGHGNIAVLDNVTTLESFRGHNYAGVMMSDVLSDSSYDVAFLNTTSKGKGLYEHLGFVTVG